MKVKWLAVFLILMLSLFSQIPVQGIQSSESRTGGTVETVHVDAGKTIIYLAPYLDLQIFNPCPYEINKTVDINSDTNISLYLDVRWDVQLDMNYNFPIALLFLKMQLCDEWGLEIDADRTILVGIRGTEKKVYLETEYLVTNVSENSTLFNRALLYVTAIPAGPLMRTRVIGRVINIHIV